MATLLAEIQFEHPLRLLWLVAILPVVFFAWRSSVTAPRGRRILSVGCRVAIVVLLTLAFAGLSRHWRSDQRYVVFVTDVSRSVSGPAQDAANRFIDAALQNRGHHQGLVMPFAGKAGEMTEQALTSVEGLNDLASDPETALRLASAAIPDNRVPQVVLLTDGLATKGDLAKAAIGSRVPVSVVPLSPFSEPEACVSELTAPPVALPFQDLPLDVVIDSNHGDQGTLEILRDGQPVGKESVDLEQGGNWFRFRVPPGAHERSVFEVRLSGVKDTIAENNRRRAAVFAPPRPRVLVASADPTAARRLAETLRGQGCEPTERLAGELPGDAAALAAYDLIALVDIEPKPLPADVTSALQQHVAQAGAGLVVIGGKRTFSVAAYRGTELEKLLPVKAADEVAAKKQSVLAMMLVIDKSSSMEEENRMKLAKQAAKQVVGVLEPHDKVGVIAFANDPEWVVEITACGDKTQVLQRIDTLEPFGQTHMYQGVERAFLALEQTDADRRHMILLTDGVPSPGDYGDLARRMAEAGITVSTVSLGKGAEQDLLEDVARLANGRHHPCENPADVGQIMVQETKAAAAETGPGELPAMVFRALPGLDVRSAPNLPGYAPTSPKPNTELLLIVAGSDPLLSWWRQGAGIAVAMTSDARSWQSWPGYGAFWRRLVRQAARPSRPSVLKLDLTRKGAEVTATLETPVEAAPDIAKATVAFTVTKPDGKQQALTGRQAALGRYQAVFAVEAEGGYFVEATLAVASRSSAPERRALFVDYPDELRLQSANEALLKAVAATTGGTYNPAPESIFAPDDRTVPASDSPWSILVAVALVLFVVDVSVRRVRF